MSDQEFVRQARLRYFEKKGASAPGERVGGVDEKTIDEQTIHMRHMRARHFADSLN